MNKWIKYQNGHTKIFFEKTKQKIFYIGKIALNKKKLEAIIDFNYAGFFLSYFFLIGNFEIYFPWKNGSDYQNFQSCFKLTLNHHFWQNLLPQKIQIFTNVTCSSIHSCYIYESTGRYLNS